MATHGGQRCQPNQSSFFLISFWVFDMDNIQKQAATVGAIFAVDTVSLVLFGTMLGWL
jgi:hypothetical protein